MLEASSPKKAKGTSPCSSRHSSFSSAPSDFDISSGGLLQMQRREGFDAYLGSETENVADIFGRSESIDDLHLRGLDDSATVRSG